jgi:hypothetical protein
VHWIISNPTYVGKIRWRDKVFDGVHEPLVDEFTFAKAQATLAERGEHAKRRGNADVECPSLSPDGTRVAYKRALPGGGWRLTVLHLATGKETQTAETRSVDDQAEWLDNERILYGHEGAIWTVPADGTGQPRQLLDAALSPAVLH